MPQLYPHSQDGFVPTLFIEFTAVLQLLVSLSSQENASFLSVRTNVFIRISLTLICVENYMKSNFHSSPSVSYFLQSTLHLILTPSGQVLPPKIIVIMCIQRTLSCPQPPSGNLDSISHSLYLFKSYLSIVAQALTIFSDLPSCKCMCSLLNCFSDTPAPTTYSTPWHAICISFRTLDFPKCSQVQRL